MKKLINDAQEVIKEELEGLQAAHSSLKVNLEPAYIWRADAPIKNKVAIVSGGGSGHEPLHGGFVGSGMLDAACPGEVFTSPTPDQMYEAAKKVNSGAGVLFIVKNYTGDVLNFETAAEMAHAEGIPVQAILVDDDVAVKDSSFTAGRRGVGTTVILEKIVGAAAEAGYSLNELADLARKISLRGHSMGIALTSNIVPASGNPTFTLQDDEIEMGIGIHGEPGQKRIKHKPAKELTQMMTEEILNDKGYKRTVREWDNESGNFVEKELEDEAFESGDELIVLVNSMGGTPLLELYIVYNELERLLKDKHFTMARNLIGPYITSLEMQGMSLTLVKADEEMLRLWDAPVNTPGLRWGV